MTPERALSTIVRDCHTITAYPLYRASVLYDPLQLYDKQTPLPRTVNTSTRAAYPCVPLPRSPPLSPTPTTLAQYSNNNTRTHPCSPSVSASVPPSRTNQAHCASYRASTPLPPAGPPRPPTAPGAPEAQVDDRSSAVNEGNRSHTSPLVTSITSLYVPAAADGRCRSSCRAREAYNRVRLSESGRIVCRDGGWLLRV